MRAVAKNTYLKDSDGIFIEFYCGQLYKFCYRGSDQVRVMDKKNRDCIFERSNFDKMFEVHY